MGEQMMTISASRTAAAASRVKLSAKFNDAAISRLFWVRAVTATWSARPSRLMMRASDDAIRPMPISAMRPKLLFSVFMAVQMGSEALRRVNSSRAATTARISSSSPMEMRSASGRP